MNKIQLHIPTPCHENWNAMQPQEQGRHCNACAKTVVDFTTMSDSQIIDYVNNTPGRLCGRFAQDQLDQQLTPINTNKKQAWWVMLAMPLLLLFSNKTKAQGQIVKAPVEDTVVKRRPEIMGKIAVPRAKYIITGRVIDQKGDAIPYATIKIKNAKSSVATDVNGNFSLVLPQPKDSVTISSIGTKDLSAGIDFNVQKSYVFTMLMNSTDLGEFIVVHKPKKKKIIDSIPLLNRLTSDKIFTGYPNPIAAGNMLNIDFKKEGKYSLQILDGNGSLLSHADFDATKKAMKTTMPINSTIAKGQYYLSVVNVDTKKVVSQKIIIQ